MAQAADHIPCLRVADTGHVYICVCLCVVSGNQWHPDRHHRHGLLRPLVHRGDPVGHVWHLGTCNWGVHATERSSRTQGFSLLVDGALVCLHACMNRSKRIRKTRSVGNSNPISTCVSVGVTTRFCSSMRVSSLSTLGTKTVCVFGSLAVDSFRSLDCCRCFQNATQRSAWSPSARCNWIERSVVRYV